ncbi:hypothetical protein IV203_031677 [Nitzschia inconspicua]|uniref:Uncharacterized protein n=1 Tax=Nitzschia inconspicua TaxID=303405 RepID=A0A9K3LVR6_9STRA|nr:hypothetical protein IV203_031677 [Nitzschia inconspicua]
MDLGWTIHAGRFVVPQRVYLQGQFVLGLAPDYAAELGDCWLVEVKVVYPGEVISFGCGGGLLREGSDPFNRTREKFWNGFGVGEGRTWRREGDSWLTNFSNTFNMPPDPFTGIPADIQAFRNGWTEITDHGHNPDPVLCCLEIKTRVAESTIVKAELARKKHGSFVNCSCGDAVINNCVPAANRYQVLHQALVTGFQHGVFVVCKLEDGQGSIVQTVVIKISTEQRDEYAENLRKVVNPPFGFLHSEGVIARGILMDSNFPDWVTDPQRTILKKRAKLYYGHLKLISTEEGDLRPTKPLSIYKHSTQYRYNKHKPELYMNTEISDRVAFHTTGPFETKYVFRMLDAVMVNAWRAYQAVTMISPWLRTQRSHPSLAQLRNKLHNSVGVEDFVADVALECLRCLAAQKVIPLFPAEVAQKEREEQQFKSEFSEYKRKHGLPIRKFALKKFASDPFLKLCTLVDHRPQRIREVQPVILENGTSQKVVRRKCVLCFVPGKLIPGTSTIKSKEIANNSTYMCPTCMVVLCKKTVGNSGAKSCHTLWHERHNLDAEGSKCRKRLRVAREMNDDEAQKRKLHATNASIKRHLPAKTSQQIQRSQTQVAINDPQDPQDSFDTFENVIEHVLENLMEMEHGEEHDDEEKEEDQQDFLDMEEYSDGSDNYE